MSFGQVCGVGEGGEMNITVRPNQVAWSFNCQLLNLIISDEDTPVNLIQEMDRV